MSNWIPTNELRFVERGRYEDTETVLQQKWADKDPTKENWLYPVKYEWRDVPVVEESDD